MCYFCPAEKHITVDGRDFTLRRVEDEYSIPSMMNIPQDAVAGYESGDWAFIGLVADLDGEPVSELCGIAEGLTVQCAYEDDEAVATLCEAALRRLAEG